MTHKIISVFVFTLLLLTASLQANAHGSAENLNDTMLDKEKYFQVINKPAPGFSLIDGEGKKVSLNDYKDKIVVLNFMYTSCPDVCPLQAEALADIQEMINLTPMKNLVQFISITTDPSIDRDDVLKNYGPAHGLNSANWIFLTTRPSSAENTTRNIAQTFGHKFNKTDDGYQNHGVVTHVINQNGQWAANFHGLRFDPVNLVSYINSLSNSNLTPSHDQQQGLFDKIKSFFD